MRRKRSGGIGRMLEVLRQLIEVNLAAAAAVIVVLMLRGIVRRIAGAHAAYLLWVFVPAAVVAVLVPGKVGPPQIMTIDADLGPVRPEDISGAMNQFFASYQPPVVTSNGNSWSIDWSAVVIVALPWLWLAGVV